MLVRFVVVNYRSEPTLRRCLESICAQTVADFEVVVVDNGAEEAAFAAAIPADPRIRCLRLGANTGFAAGTNAGAGDSRAPWLAAINPDAFLAPDWLAVMMAATRRYPEVAMFGSTQRDAAVPDRLDGAGDVYAAIGIPWRGHHGRPVRECPPTGPVFSPCAAAALYRFSAFAAVGGFDPGFFCYCEDVDLAFRLRLRGERAIQVRQAVVDHVGSASSGPSSDFSVYHGFRNRLWTFVKCMPPPLFAALLPLHVAATLGLLALAAGRGLLAPALRGLGAALWGLGPVLRQRRHVQATRTVGWRRIAEALTWSPRAILLRRHDVRPDTTDTTHTTDTVLRPSRTGRAKAVSRRLWRTLPALLRSHAFNTISGWFLPQAARRRPPAPAVPPPVIVVAGLFRTASGIGESARLCYQALVACGYTVQAFDLSAVFDQVDLDPNLPLVTTIDAPSALVIVHVNAPEVQRALWAMGRRRHPGWTVVGYWAWELPIFPAGWNRAFAFLDEVWTPSRFCASHLQHPDAPPIRVVPHPVVVAVPPPCPGARAKIRARFGLPEHAFIALAFADARSSMARKNPAAAIAAFVHAFGDRADTVLVVKTRNLGVFASVGNSGTAAATPAQDNADLARTLISSSLDVDTSRLPSNAGRAHLRPWLRAHAGAGPQSRPDTSTLPSNAGRAHPRPWLRAHANLHVLDATLSHAEIMDLMGCCDTILSLHRSEGFGLCLAQGMALGKPVIASAWSGNCDFMDDTTALLVPVTLVPVEDPSGIYAANTTHWAAPDIKAAAAALVALEQDRALAAALGQAGQRRVNASLGVDAYATATGLPRPL